MNLDILKISRQVAKVQGKFKVIKANSKFKAFKVFQGFKDVIHPGVDLTGLILYYHAVRDVT